MSPKLQLALGTDAERYVALFRISEALSACGEPEQLARVLAGQLRGLISFDHLDVLILKENSSEIEWHGWGTAPAAFPDLPVEETSSWHVYNTQERPHADRDDVHVGMLDHFVRVGKRVGNSETLGRCALGDRG